MKIECLIKRKGGSVIEMEAPARTYHFAPENGNHEDPHVADVLEQSHVRCLLRIREAYRVLSGEELPEEAQQQIKHEQELVGSNIHSASYPIKGGETIALADLITMAFEDSCLDYDQWNEATDEERYAYIDATLLELQVGVEDEQSIETAKQAPAEQVKPETVKQEPVVQPKPEEKAEPTALTDLPRKELAVLYQKRFGRQPSTRMTIDDIANALSEED